MADNNVNDGLNDITDGVRKLFLAGVGAVALGAEKTQEVVSDLVKKGEITVEQGKALNEELTRKAKEAVASTTDAALKSRLKAMTPDERAAYAAKVAKMAADLDAEPVEVEVDDAEASDSADEPHEGDAE